MSMSYTTRPVSLWIITAVFPLVLARVVWTQKGKGKASDTQLNIIVLNFRTQFCSFCGYRGLFLGATVGVRHTCHGSPHRLVQSSRLYSTTQLNTAAVSLH